MSDTEPNQNLRRRQPSLNADSEQIVLNHYDHEASIAAGHRVFWVRRGNQELDLTTRAFAEWLGYRGSTPHDLGSIVRAINALLLRSGFRLGGRVH
jgi:hypothetical protein